MAERRRPPDAREFAWDALDRIEAGGFSDAVVGTGLAASQLAGAERNLATTLVYGTLTWRAYVDHLLASFVSRPLGDLDGSVLNLLRLALYQLTKLDRVPAFAVVHTAVELCKRRQRRSAGLVNAVLRRAAVEWRSVGVPAAEHDLAGHLAIVESHPRWLIERWLSTLGEADTRALLAANNSVAPTVARVNSRRSTREELLAAWAARAISAHPTKFAHQGLVIDGTINRPFPGYAEGEFAWHGEASQLVGELVDAKPGERILDLCAAPGGKACQVAEKIGDAGQVVAVDVSQSGLERLRAEARRLGLDRIETIRADGTSWLPADGAVFDRVLIDAPCTGLGTLRQHPEIRWRRAPLDIARNATLQRRLLRHAVELLKPGGVLIYATCTLDREENEETVQSAAAAGALRVDVRSTGLGPAAACLVGADGYLRTWPHRHGLDGFFAARLLRNEGERRVA